MASAWPASLKPLGKYLARGLECKEASPIASYYCNLYSAKEGIRRISGSDDALGEQFVKALLEKCETEKQFVGSDDGTHQQIVEAYALARFKEADDEDIYGPVTQATARKYFYAMCYLDVCGIFGKLSDDLESKKEFAKHRAAAITKAFREGREPEPREMPEVQPAASEETPLPPSQVDAHQPYPYTMIGVPAEPSAPLPTTQYNMATMQQYAIPGAAGPAEPSAPLPTAHYDEVAIQQYAAAGTAGLPEPSAPLPTAQYDPTVIQHYAASGATGPAEPPPATQYPAYPAAATPNIKFGGAAGQKYGVSGASKHDYNTKNESQSKIEFDHQRSDSRQSYGKSSYPPSEQRWTPSSSPPPDPRQTAPDEAAANAIEKLSLGAAYPDVAPVYESFDDKQPFVKSSQGAPHPQPPTRPLPPPPAVSPYSGAPKAFDRLKQSMTSSTASFGSDASSVQAGLYTPIPQSVAAQSPAQPPQQQQALKGSGGGPPPAVRSNYTPSIQNMKVAQGYARDAFSALDFPDVNGAITFLEKALAELRGS